MKKYILKNGTLIDKKNGLLFAKKDILVENGIIKSIASEITEKCDIVDATNLLVSPGFIDIHIHTQILEKVGTDADILGYHRGTTTVIECGTIGANNVQSFAYEAQKYKTKYHGLLGAHSDNGFIPKDEISIDNIHFNVFEKAVQDFPNIIVGLKCACSASITGDKGYDIVKKAKEMARNLNLPVTVHVGSYPPDPCELIELLQCGDIITHTYHGKEISLFQQDGKAKDCFIKAKERGVLFDVGHGRESFSWNKCKLAMKNGFFPDLIGTDIYDANMNGPVYSLAVVMSKIINLGMSLEDAIHCVTYKAAETYRLKNIGQLHPGYCADFTLFTFDNVDYMLKDSYGKNQPIKNVIVPRKVIISGGEDSELFTCDEGHIKI